jgi:hypothetical protein
MKDRAVFSCDEVMVVFQGTCTEWLGAIYFDWDGGASRTNRQCQVAQGGSIEWAIVLAPVDDLEQ